MTNENATRNTIDDLSAALGEIVSAVERTIAGEPLGVLAGPCRRAKAALAHRRDVIRDAQQQSPREPMEAQPGTWSEYDSAAEWCATRGLKGVPGDALPENLSAVVAAEIADHPDEFEERVRAFAYALAMEKIEANVVRS